MSNMPPPPAGEGEQVAQSTLKIVNLCAEPASLNAAVCGMARIESDPAAALRNARSIEETWLKQSGNVLAAVVVKGSVDELSAAAVKFAAFIASTRKDMLCKSTFETDGEELHGKDYETLIALHFALLQAVDLIEDWHDQYAIINARVKTLLVFTDSVQAVEKICAFNDDPGQFKHNEDDLFEREGSVLEKIASAMLELHELGVLTMILNAPTEATDLSQIAQHSAGLELEVSLRYRKENGFQD